MAPLTCVLIEANDTFVANDRGTYGNGFKVLRVFEKNFSGNGSRVSEMNMPSRVCHVVTYLREEVLPNMQENDTVVIEKQIPPSSRACDSTIPYESFIAICSFFCTVKLRVFEISSSLKNKVDIGAVPVPSRTYKSKYAQNKAIACARLEYLSLDIPSVVPGRCKKGASHHVADAILQLVAYLSIRGTNEGDMTRLS